MVRAQEMARYVESGTLDAGITGHDWVVETEADVEELSELVYAKQRLVRVRWVLAAPEDSLIRGPRDLEGKVIATEVVQITQNYLAKHGVKARVEFSWGATEVKVPQPADAIVEVAERGSSRRAHRLRIVDPVLESATVLIMNRPAAADCWKRQKAESLILMLQGAIAAASKVGLLLNVHRADLPGVLGVLPALKKRSEEHTSELQSRLHLVCRLLLEKTNRCPASLPDISPRTAATRDCSLSMASRSVTAPSSRTRSPPRVAVPRSGMWANVRGNSITL